MSEDKRMVPSDNLTVEQIAQELGIRPETVRRYIKQQELQATMPFGRKGGYRVKPTDYQAFKQKRGIA